MKGRPWANPGCLRQWPAAATGLAGSLTLSQPQDAAGDKHEWGWGSYLTTLLNAQVSADGTQVSGSLWSPWPPKFYGASGVVVGVNYLQPYSHLVRRRFSDFVFPIATSPKNMVPTLEGT